MMSSVKMAAGVAAARENFAEGFGFVVRNLWCARRLARFPEATFDTYRVAALRPAQVAAADRLYANLTGEAGQGRMKRWLMRLIGPRLTVVAQNACTGELVGLICFYFNARDRRENTIHIGFYGLTGAARSKGLGSFMTAHALGHLARTHLSGVSSRVSCDNLPSLRVMTRLGFAPVETYFDRRLWEERHYMMCDLKRHAAPAANQQGSVNP